MHSRAQQSASVSRGRLIGRIAGAAVAAGLFLGAPLLTTLAVSPGVAVAKPGEIDGPNLDFSMFDRCVKPVVDNDCDRDGVTNADEA